MEDVSVVVVSDYSADSPAAWEDRRKILTALADQDFREGFETILVENERVRGRVPEDIAGLLPASRICYADTDRSTELKYVGAAQTAGSLIAVLEADCIPNRQWLRVLVEALREEEGFSAACGRTTYPNKSSPQRALTVLDRGYQDLGDRSETPDFHNHGAVYRREVYMSFPYPEMEAAFVSATTRVKSLRAAGHRCLFVPEAALVHAMPGWGFVTDLRRNKGYDSMVQRTPPRYSAIPGAVIGRIRAGMSQCRRLGPRDFRWWDWPMAGILALALPFLEIPGMLDAIRGEGKLRKTGFR